MKLASLLRPDLIRCGLTASTKHDALVELVRLLAAAEPEITAPELLQALADRERLGPFSMGKGVAFPHARTEKVKDFTIVLGTSGPGIDFRAPDGHRIKIAVLFVIPKKHSNLYLHALAAFLNFFGSEANLQRVVEAKTPEEVLAVFEMHAGKGREAGPAEPGVAALTPGATLGRAIDLMAQTKMEVVPLVDAEGNLVGEVSAAGILKLGIKDAAAPEETADTTLRRLADAPMETIPGLIATNGYKTVQEGSSTQETAAQVARAGGRCVYILKGRRLVGVASATELLRRLSGRTSS